MSERSFSLYPQGFGEAPLSFAFREAWLQWREIWPELSNSGEDEKALVERAANAAGRVVRHLWRNAFASVGESSSHQVKAMTYAFVALLDERLLFDEWPGRAGWQARPLESRLYGSRSAGERLPRAIHKLLREREPSSRDLANVYLQCLMLGFHGALRSKRGQAMHERWRHALFSFAWQRDPLATGAATTLDIPLKAAPLQMPMRRILPDNFNLALLILAVTLLLTAAGHWMWRDIQAELAPVVRLALDSDDGDSEQ